MYGPPYIDLVLPSSYITEWVVVPVLEEEMGVKVVVSAVYPLRTPVCVEVRFPIVQLVVLDPKGHGVVRRVGVGDLVSPGPPIPSPPASP